jgi:hypothetical protein
LGRREAFLKKTLCLSGSHIATREKADATSSSLIEDMGVLLWFIAFI